MCDLKNGECRKCKFFQHILANTSFQMFEMGTRESFGSALGYGKPVLIG